VETDLRPLNLGLATAKRRTQDRAAWRRLVATATSTLTSSWMMNDDDRVVRCNSEESQVSYEQTGTPDWKMQTAGLESPGWKTQDQRRLMNRPDRLINYLSHC